MIRRLNVLCLVLTCFVVSIFAVPLSSELEQSNSLKEASLATLKYVVVISRHGSRTPLRTYPNDPYPYKNKLFWPTGPGELTYYGKQQLYQTGEKLRQRYKMFLPDMFYPNDTIGEYNNLNRNFMSGACLLASLYPPMGREIWNKDLLWQPIPLYVRKFDVCKLYDGNICPAYKVEAQRLLDVLNNQENSVAPITELMKNLTEFTGFNFTTYSQLSGFYDILTMQIENGFKLPEWTNDLYPEPLKSLVAPLPQAKFGGSKKLIELGAGPELKYISDQLNMKASGKYENNRKFYIEIGHDCTLMALLKAMGINEKGLMVRTSAYMIFELHYLPEMYIVQVFYYENSSDDNPMIIDIAGCPNPCSLDNFTKFVENINLPDWHAACQNTHSG